MSLPPRRTAAPEHPGVPLFDSRRQFDTIQSEVLAAVEKVCRSGRYVLGAECQQLEEALAAYCGAPQSVSCASCSDALLLALMAVGITAGDEVLLPSYTFFATASAVWRLGARPVFVEIEQETYLLDPRHVAERITPATKAIIPVHLFGQCADMDAINAIAQRHGLTVIEDAAQAMGAEFGGRRAGSLAPIGCFSFYPTKNLGCLGDGGLLTANSESLADRLKLLRGHGMRPRYHHQEVGINSRLDSIQAAVLLAKLPYLEQWTAQRIANAARYQELFAECGLDRELGLPTAAAGRRHVWNQYVIRVPDGRRDALVQYLAERNIGTEIYYPVPLHLQPCFHALGYQPGSLPETEQAARETLALPIFPELTAAEQQQVVGQIAEFWGAGRSSPPRPKFLASAQQSQAHANRTAG